MSESIDTYHLRLSASFLVQTQTMDICSGTGKIVKSNQALLLVGHNAWCWENQQLVTYWDIIPLVCVYVCCYAPWSTQDFQYIIITIPPPSHTNLPANTTTILHICSRHTIHPYLCPRDGKGLSQDSAESQTLPPGMQLHPMHPVHPQLALFPFEALPNTTAGV